MNQALLDDADRIVAADLYPARCRRVVANLAATLREQSSDLAESRQYALALEEELRARAERMDQLLLLANSMDADFETYTKAHPVAAPDPAAIREAALMKGALEYYADQFCEGFCQDMPDLTYTDENCERDCGGCKARSVLALIQKGATDDRA